MEKPGFQNTVLCPYDKAHTVLKDRMQFHLTKCRKNYPSVEKVECRFNKTHVVNKPELEYHHKNCSDRVVIDRFFYGDSICAAGEMIPVNSAEVPQCNEDWDAEENTVSVLDVIKEKNSEKQLLRYLPGTTRAQRKNFRQQERVRHQHLEENGGKLPDPEPKFNMTCSAYKKPDRVVLPPPRTVPEFTRNLSDDVDGNFTGFVGRGRGRMTPVEREQDLEEKFKKLGVTPGRDMVSGVPPQFSQTAEVDRTSLSSAVSQENIQSREEVNIEIPKFNFPVTEKGFCHLPIPGLGRGKRRNK